MEIGCIGDVMGKPAALKLLKADYAVRASSRGRTKCAPVAAADARSGSYLEAAEDCSRHN